MERKKEKTTKGLGPYLMLTPSLMCILLFSFSPIKAKPESTSANLSRPHCSLIYCHSLSFFISSIKDTTIEEDMISDTSHKQQPTASKGKVYEFVEQMPSFPGGQKKLMQYLQKNIRYPGKAIKKRMYGTVLVMFVVDTDGTITDVTRVGRSRGKALDKEAIRVIKNMPKWIPGKNDGKNVRVQYTIPIRFQL